MTSLYKNLSSQWYNFISIKTEASYTQRTAANFMYPSSVCIVEVRGVEKNLIKAMKWTERVAGMAKSETYTSTVHPKQTDRCTGVKTSDADSRRGTRLRAKLGVRKPCCRTSTTEVGTVS